MIKLQDFAREIGLTDRQVHRQLTKYAAELEGLYERQGVNGTWLTDEACAFIRSKMKKAPITISDPDERVLALEAMVKDLREDLREKDKLLLLSQSQVQEAQKHVAELQEKAGKVYLLEEGKKLLEAKIEAAEDSRDEYKALADQKAQEAAEASQKATEEALRVQELQEALKAAEEATETVKEQFKAMSLWEFLKSKRKKE